MEKFLYLEQYWFVDSWVDGGSVPLKVASTYKKNERGGIYTPDENIIDNSTHAREQFKGLVHISGSKPIGLKFENCDFGEVGKFPLVEFDIKHEDGLVLCLANRRSNYIAKRLGKVACVKILDITKLKAALDQEIGIIGDMGLCTYVSDHKRGHFTKSSKDAWQDEFRIFWPGATTQHVMIPQGTAVRIPIRGR